MRTAARRQTGALVAETRDLDENTFARSLGASLEGLFGDDVATANKRAQASHWTEVRWPR